ncbi:MAG TPA: PDZ domain-containing protein [Vicinamibacterales bacterium]|nr:PDZ domain-containing protein [Vicinamibacterales bacterium]
MLRRIRVTRGSAPATWPPVWVLIVASSFCAYFVLLLYCEIVRPENAGFSCAPGTLMVSTVLPGSPADRAGVRRGDRLVALNGLGMESADSWAAVGANFQMGVPMPIVVERDGRAIVLQLRLERMPPAYWRTQPGAFLLIVRSALFLTLLAGLLIAWRRPRDPIALTAAWLLLTCAVFAIAMPLRIVTVWRELPVPVSLLLWIPYASSLNFAAVLLTFVAGFPRRLPYAARVQTATWIVAAVVSARPLANFAALIRGADVLRPVGPATTPLLAASVVWLAAVVVIIIVNYGHITDLNERRRLRAVLAGIGTAALPRFLAHRVVLDRAQAQPRGVDLRVAGPAARGRWPSWPPPCRSPTPSSGTAFSTSASSPGSGCSTRWRWAVLSVAPVLMATIVVELLAHGHETRQDAERRRPGVTSLG